MDSGHQSTFASQFHARAIGVLQLPCERTSSICRVFDARHDGRSTKMFRKSLLAAALLAGTSLGAMAGTVTPLTKATPPRRRRLRVPADRRHAPLSGRLADRLLPLQAGQVRQLRERHLISRCGPPSELCSRRHLRRRPARRAPGVHWRRVYLAVKQQPHLFADEQDGGLRSEGGDLDDVRAAFRSRLGFYRQFAVDVARQRASPCSGISSTSAWPNSILRP